MAFAPVVQSEYSSRWTGVVRGMFGAFSLLSRLDSEQRDGVGRAPPNKALSRWHTRNSGSHFTSFGYPIRAPLSSVCGRVHLRKSAAARPKTRSPEGANSSQPRPSAWVNGNGHPPQPVSPEGAICAGPFGTPFQGSNGSAASPSSDPGLPAWVGMDRPFGGVPEKPG
jgi:hypothetical protein